MRTGRNVSLAWTARLLASVAVVFISSERAEGCQCVATSPCQALSSADAIFAGLVSDISQVYTADGNSISGSVVTLAIERNFVDALGIVVLKQDHNSCNVQFRLGQRYLVYARRGSDGSLATSQCSGTKLLAEADDDLAFLMSLPPAGTGGTVTVPWNAFRLICSDTP